MLWILVLSTTTRYKSSKIVKPYSDNICAILISVLKIYYQAIILYISVATVLDIYTDENILKFKIFIYLECLW